MSEEIEVLKIVTGRLGVAGIPYMITGSMALISKLDWTRDTRSEVQLTDARDLLQSVPGLDRSYLERWTAHLGLEALYREVSR